MCVLQYIVFGFCLVLLTSGCSAPLTSGPVRMPGIVLEELRAGYWISRCDDPDVLVLDESAVEARNAAVREEGTVIDIFDKTLFVEQEEWARGDIARNASGWLDTVWHDFEGRRIPRAFIQDCIDNTEPKQTRVPKDTYGVVTRQTMVKSLPSERPFQMDARHTNFDILARSSVRLNEPVRVMLISRDTKWYYVRTARTAGWISAKSIGLTSAPEIMGLSQKEKTVVIRVPYADIFASQKARRYLGSARMGARFHVVEATPDHFCIEYPVWKEGEVVYREGWLDRSDAVMKALPCTRRALIETAFSLLHRPYGWGGDFGFWDCSQFVMDVFEVFDIMLPRNSADQREAGRILWRTPDTGKNEALHNASPATTLLALDGHIMLLIGARDGRFYVVHDTWGFSRARGDVAVVNRVVVSDLALGKGSRRGSFKERLVAITAIE